MTTLRLNLGELRWLENNVHRPPAQLISGFFRYRGRLKPPTVPVAQRPAVLCELLSSTNNDDFQIDGQPSRIEYFDDRLLARLADAVANGTTDYRLEARDVIRGYSERDFRDFERAANGEIRKLTRRLRTEQQANHSRIRTAERTRREGVVAALRENAEALEALVGEVNALSAGEIARERLSRSNWDRRVPSLAVVGRLRDPLEPLRWRVEFSLSAQRDMPLRFYTRVSVPLWRGLVKSAASGASRRDQVALLLTETKLAEVLVDIQAVNEQLVALGLPERALAGRELAQSWGAGQVLATSLVAASLTEGRLWDLAELLNRRNHRIFASRRNKHGRLQRVAYVWDHATGRHRREGKRLALGPELTSARQLIRQTRLGALVSQDLRSFLVDEHSEFRNPLMHGRIEASADDMIVAVLCCHATLSELVSICQAKVPGRAQ